MPIYHHKSKLKSEDLSREIIKYWDSKENCQYVSELNINNQRADIFLTCETGNVAVEVKSYAPTLSDVSQVSGFAVESSKNYTRETIAVIVFPNEKVSEDVQKFADERNVKLYPTKDITKLKEKIDSDFNF